MAAQYVWPRRYIDAPVLRDRDADSDSQTGDLGVTGSGLDERLYYTTDANMNVTALVDTDGDVVERYAYDAYGQVTVLNGANGTDPDVDGNTVFEWDIDADGASDVANTVLFAGYHFDTETGLYHVRHRMYHATLGRWLQRDPIGYGDGSTLYQYCRSSPVASVDPSGLSVHGTEIGDTYTEHATDASWAKLGLPSGVKGITVHGVKVVVDGVFYRTSPCACTFIIKALDLYIAVHVAGEGVAYSRPYGISRRMTASDVASAKQHENMHREQWYRIWKRYRAQLSERKTCDYYRGWMVFKRGYRQSAELCGDRAEALANYLKDQLGEYLERAAEHFDSFAVRASSAEENRAGHQATMRMIDNMEMRDWNCDDTSLGWFR